MRNKLLIHPYAIFPFLFQNIFQLPVNLLLRFFCKLKIRGVKNIHSIDENFILASNHINELDGFFIPAAIPFTSGHLPIFPVTLQRKYYKNKGLRGRYIYTQPFFKFMGAWPAYIGLNNYKKSLKNHIEILEDGYNIFIFPEGKIENSKNPKGGVAFLSFYTQKPIVPVHVNGIKGMTVKEFLFRKRTLTITFGAPIYPWTMFEKTHPTNPEKYKQVAEKVMRTVYNL